MDKIFLLSYFVDKRHVKLNAKVFRLLKNNANLQLEFNNCYCSAHKKFIRIEE